MTQLHDLTLLEQVNAVRAREVSPMELTEHYQSRIDRHGADLGAFVTLTPELALEESRRAAQAVVSDPTGDAPLLGIPLAFKDCHPVAGVRTTFGCKALENHIPAQDGWAVGNLRRAGVVTLGTTHAPELGLACYTETDVVDRPALLPFDTARYAAGSSGGAAASVAAGLQPAAHGSDGLGSIRAPAAVCGLVGMKPSRGLVSTAPAGAFVSFGIEGPLARTVFDAALLLDVMAGPAPGDLYSGRVVPGMFRAAATAPAPRRLRVAMCKEVGLGVSPDDAALRAVDDAARALEALGHTITDVPTPVLWDEQLLDAVTVLFGAAAAATVDAMVAEERRTLLRPFTRHVIAVAMMRSASQYHAAQLRVADAARRYTAGVDDYDLVLTPTTSAPAQPVGWFTEGGVEDIARRTLGWLAYTPWANLNGRPAISLPMGAAAGGLPVGVQLMGTRLGDDELLLSTAAALEREDAWQMRHPPQWQA